MLSSTFIDEMGYGLERGGVNIDHGGDNLILHNSFVTNKCGVHLWGGANPGFEKKNWARANGYASTGSAIADNSFDGDSVGFHFRGPGQVVLGRNKLVGVGEEMMADPTYQVIRDDQRAVEPLAVPEHKVFGKKHPVGARPELRGRQNIIMTEWGPWDHVAPLVRLVKSAGGMARFEVLKVPWATRCAPWWPRFPGRLTNRRSPSAPWNREYAPMCSGCRRRENRWPR